MPVEIKTKITPSPKNSLDHPKTRESVRRVSEDHDYSSFNGLLPHNFGEQRLSITPSEKGPVVKETMIFPAEELDPKGNIQEIVTTREAVLKNDGDTFSSRLLIRKVGSGLETHDITISRVSLQTSED
jgi:hypothetical protein